MPMLLISSSTSNTNDGAAATPTILNRHAPEGGARPVGIILFLACMAAILIWALRRNKSRT